MDAAYAKGVAAAVSKAADIVEEAGRKPASVALTYFRSQESFDEDFGPNVGNW